MLIIGIHPLDLLRQHTLQGQRGQLLQSKEAFPQDIEGLGKRPALQLAKDKKLIYIIRYSGMRMLAHIHHGQQADRKHIQARLLFHLFRRYLFRGIPHIAPSAGQRPTSVHFSRTSKISSFSLKTTARISTFGVTYSWAGR